MMSEISNSEMINVNNIHGSNQHTALHRLNPMINSPNQVINDEAGVAYDIANDPSISSPTFTISTPPNSHKRRRKPAGTPDPDAEVVALSPKTLMESDRYVCEICNQGFQRDQNLQMHRRRHKVPWKLLKRSINSEEVRKRVYVCPEPSCLHHDPCHALGDLVGIKKHYRRKHSRVKQWECEKCSKAYAVQSDYKAHLKTCGTRGHCCDCGRVFSRVESFIEHQDACVAARQKPSPTTATTAVSSGSEQQHHITAASDSAMAVDMNHNSEYSTARPPPWYSAVLTPTPNPNYIQNPNQQQQLSIASINNNGNVIISSSTDLQQHHQDLHHHHHHHQFSAALGFHQYQKPPVVINLDDSISAASRVSDQKSEITAELQLLPTIESSQSSINEESAAAAGIAAASSSSPSKPMKTPSPPKLQLSIGLLDPPVKEQQPSSCRSRINGSLNADDDADDIDGAAGNRSDMSWLRQGAAGDDHKSDRQELASTTATEASNDEAAAKLSWRLRINGKLDAEEDRLRESSTLPSVTAVPAKFNSVNNSSTCHVIPASAVYYGQGQGQGQGQSLVDSNGHDQGQSSLHSHDSHWPGQGQSFIDSHGHSHGQILIHSHDSHRIGQDQGQGPTHGQGQCLMVGHRPLHSPSHGQSFTHSQDSHGPSQGQSLTDSHQSHRLGHGQTFIHSQDSHGPGQRQILMDSNHGHHLGQGQTFVDSQDSHGLGQGQGQILMDGQGHTISSSSQAVGRSVHMNNQVMMNCMISCPSCQHTLVLYASPGTSSNPPSFLAFPLGANPSK